MILHSTADNAARGDPNGEQLERRLSLLRCLKRMGFYDPEALLAQTDAPVQRLDSRVTALAIPSVAM